MDKNELESMVRKIILEMAPSLSGEAFEKRKDRSGILSVSLPTVRPMPFDTGKEGDQVSLTDVLTLEESPRLGCGIMEMEESSFDWILRYDEVDYVIDGTLEVLIEGRKVVGRRGDMIFIPADSSITFSAPCFARFLYVTYPADWASQ